MTQKNATPNKRQAAALERSGLSKLRWVVIKELDHRLIVKHRLTDEVKVIDK